MKDKPTKEQFKMSDEARKAKAEYMKEWRKRNPGKQAEYQERYWLRKAKELFREDDEKRVHE
jgi:hypothetical protein